MTGHRSIRGARRGFTLVELVVSLAVMSVLLVGLASAVSIASRGLELDGEPLAVAAADDIVGQIERDLRFATSFTTRTSSAVAFGVPDRNGDGQAEVIRYAWEKPDGSPGAPGDPLRRTVNGGDGAVLLEHVDAFDLSYVTRVVHGSYVEAVRPPGALLVVSNGSDPTGRDLVRETLLRSWGFEVTFIDDGAPPEEFDLAIAVNDVAYVSETIDGGKLDEKLAEAPIGVVSEHEEQADDLMVEEKATRDFGDDMITIADTDHYVTSPFDLGGLTIATTSVKLLRNDGQIAPGATVLATKPGDANRATMVALDAGAARWGGSPAPARRIVLPWGKDIDLATLNADARTLMRRAVEWAAGREEVVLEVEESPEMLLAFHDDAPGGTLDQLAIEAKAWVAQHLRPAMPTNAVSWKITRVLVMLQKETPANGLLEIEIRPSALDETPSDGVLEASPLEERDLSGSFQWVESTFTGVDGLSPGSGVCLVVEGVSGTDALASARYEGGGAPMTAGTHLLTTTDGGTTWSAPNDAEDLFFYVYGTITTMGTPEWP